METVLKKSILAGMAISLGCLGYLSVDNKYLGAFLFSIGLISICSNGWYLFTGRVCFVDILEDPLHLIIVWGGNLLGCLAICLVSTLLTASPTFAIINNNWINVINNKLSKTPLSIFLCGILCEFCIYIAVVGYKKIESGIGKYLSIILGVMVFILSGFEHCVADMFYLSAFSNFEIGLEFIMIATMGNLLGAGIIRFFDK